MQKRYSFAVAVFAFGLASTVSADGPAVPEAAKTAHEKYEARMAEYRAKLVKDTKAAVTEYLTRLDEHIKAETAKGELERVLALKAERERVEKGLPTPEKETAPRAVLALRKAFETKTKAARANFEKTAKQVHAEFLTALDVVVKEETKAGRLDQALAVRTARKEFEKASPATSEDKPEPKATTQVPPKTDPKTKPGPKTVTQSPPSVNPKRSDPPFDWTKAVASPAQITVRGIEPSVLDPKAEKPRFTRIPDKFAKSRSVIYGTPKDQYSGIADITVLADGYLFLACHYGNQGNNSGNWLEQRWTAEQFVKHGWKKLDETEVGGVLTAPQNRDQVIFVKFVRKGEEMKLRCNKYDPPFAIVFDAGDK